MTIYIKHKNDHLRSLKPHALWVPIALIILGLFSGCGSHSHEGEKEGEHQHEQKEDEATSGKKEHGHGEKESGLKKVHLSPQRVQDLGISTDSLKTLSLKGKVEANGRITLAPGDRANLSTLLGGRVRSIKVMEGDQVRKGEVLAILENTEFTHIQREYLSRKEELPYLKKEYERQKSLLDEEVGSKKKFQKAKAQYFKTRSELKTYREELKTLGILERVQNGTISGTVPIRAPFDGYIGKVSASQGSFIPAHEHIVEVLHTDRIHLDLKVYEKDIGRVEKGQTVFFTYANEKESELMKGEVFKVGRKYHEKEQGIRLHVRLPDRFQKKAIPGVYVKARIKVGEKKSAALPEDAIIRQGKETFAFIQVPGSGEGEHQVFHRLPVRTGVTDAGYTGIHPLEDVPEDARYVTQGAYYLQAELKKSVGGHHH